MGQRRLQGGSEPGLLAGAWLVEDDDGARHVLVCSVVNPRDAVCTASPLSILAVCRDDLVSAG